MGLSTRSPESGPKSPLRQKEPQRAAWRAGSQAPCRAAGKPAIPVQGSPATLRYRRGAKSAPTPLPGIMASHWEMLRISTSRPRQVPPLSPHEKALTTQAPDRNSTALTTESLTGPGTAFKQPRAPLGTMAGPLSSRVRYPTASHRPGGDRTRKMGQQAQGEERKGRGKKKTNKKPRERKPLPLMRRGTRRVPRVVPHGTGVQCQPPTRPAEPRRLETYLTLIRYWAKLMLAADPVMVTCLSVDPSTGLAILICAPDIWRISLILAP